MVLAVEKIIDDDGVRWGGDARHRVWESLGDCYIPRMRRRRRAVRV